MKIILTGGVELEPMEVKGGPRFIQGANRDTLSFVFGASAGLEALDGAFTPESCESVTIQDDKGDEHVHTGYVIRCELCKETKEITPATAESEAVYGEYITVTMAQRTYSETQLAQLQAAVAALTARE